jgi:hypothetical protein
MDFCRPQKRLILELDGSVYAEEIRRAQSETRRKPSGRFPIEGVDILAAEVS